MEAKIRALLEELPGKEGALIPLLQGVQSELGYISQDAVEVISEALEISESEVYGVATFYSEFRLFEPGEHQVKVCLGTSCYLKGGRTLLERLSRTLGILPGRTTPDGKFSLETVACLGCCSRSPVMAIDGMVYGNLTPPQAEAIMSWKRRKARCWCSAETFGSRMMYFSR
jgi:NADH-quinone oxidoreductase subunit E